MNETNRCLVLPRLDTNQSGCTYWVRVANAHGTTNSTIATLTVVPGITLADAVDAPQLNWATAGSGVWRGEATNTHDQLDAAQSGTIGHSQSTWLETAVIGPGTLSFWWRTSSETSFDFLNFHVDGLPQCPGLSGILDWQQVNLPIPGGAHTLRWTYSKDGSVTAGSDAAWVDQVQFTHEFPPLSWQYTPGSNRITLTWDAPGMRLQAQTNTGTGGLSTNWFDCPGGDTSPVSLPLDPAYPSVFFRLVSPQ